MYSSAIMVQYTRSRLFWLSIVSVAVRTSSGSTQRRPKVDRTKEINVVCEEVRGNVDGLRVLGALETKSGGS